MSHTVSLKLEVRDYNIFKLAAEKLGHKVKEGEHALYGGKVNGAAVSLPGWRYPLVMTKEGEIKYDNYGGSWGQQKEMNALLTRYGIEVAKKEARKKGYTTVETTLPSGEIQVKISCGD
jgi:hypothetical protein